MKKGFLLTSLLLFFVFSPFDNLYSQSKLYFVGEKQNDLFIILENNGINAIHVKTLDKDVIRRMPRNSSIIVTADDYPDNRAAITADLYKIIQKKSTIRLFIEYPEVFPNNDYSPEETHEGTLERGVIMSDFFGNNLPKMSLLGINGCHIIPIKHNNPDISYAKIAGFDIAEYGLKDTENIPLLVRDKNVLIATTSLSNFSKGRFAPNESWKTVWQGILGWLLKDDNFSIEKWTFDPQPYFSENETLDNKDRLNSIKLGTDWFFNSGLLLHPSWKNEWLKYQGDGKLPMGPPIGADKLIGDGSMGILEGHASTINSDGTQDYRYWIRSDVQGEVAYALAAAGNILDNNKFNETSEKLLDFLFYNSGARDLTNDTTDATYGLLGWSYTHPFVIYADDNARLVLGAIGASSYLNNERWNKLIVENIIANYRTTSKYGFQGRWLNTKDISKNGWQHYFNSETIRAQPHFESWMWACYIWLYDKTGYKPLLDKAKTGIRIMMDAYPDKWRWTNGIQQERARMILPLAWLVKVDNNEEHMKWLTTLVDDLLKYQQPNGALIEAIGEDDSLASYGRSKSNADYGSTEAPLIFNNGDQVADMLYTSNFALFSLNEAAVITGNKNWLEATENLSDFLTRVQIKSERHPDLDGGWFRAFDFGRWDYWASNADSGWGAWCTLSGWIQSWIVATKVLIQNENSFWHQTQTMDVKDAFEDSLWMIE